MVIITDESNLHQAEVKAETSGMLLECQEEGYDSDLYNLQSQYISPIGKSTDYSCNCTFSLYLVLLL